MTGDDDSYDDLMPTQTNPVERLVIFGTFVLTSVGLAGFASAQYSVVTASVPEVAAFPHLLGLSILTFSVGTGGLAMAFNLFTTSTTVSQTKKVSTVYVPLVCLLTVLVDEGAFHPRLALVFVSLLSVGGILYAVLLGGSLAEIGRENT